MNSFVHCRPLRKYSRRHYNEDDWLRIDSDRDKFTVLFGDVDTERIEWSGWYLVGIQYIGLVSGVFS